MTTPNYDEQKKWIGEVLDTDNLRTLIETYTIMAMNCVGVVGDEAEQQARVVRGCVIGDLEAEHITK